MTKRTDDEITAHEGEEALRVANDMARKSRPRATAPMAAGVRVVRPVPAGDVPVDPIAGLAQRCTEDPGAWRDPIVLDELLALQSTDPAEFERVRVALKEVARVPSGELREALKALAKQREAEREAERKRIAAEAAAANEAAEAEEAIRAAEEAERARAEEIAAAPWRERHYGEAVLGDQLVVHMEPGRIVAEQTDANGNTSRFPLANFSAILAREVRYFPVPGAPPERRCEIEAFLEGAAGPETITLAADELEPMRWPTTKLAVNASVGSHRGAREQLRAALQQFRRPERVTCYGGTGWVREGGRDVFVSAGACIGPDGAVDDIRTEFESRVLDTFALPPPPEGDALRECVRTTLALFGTDPADVVVPLLGYAWATALEPQRGSVLVLAPMGVGKTSLSMLPQQHFGVGIEKPPAEWGKDQSSTGALVVLTGRVGNMVVLIDDLRLTGVPREDNDQMAQVNAVLRNLFNGTATLRLTRERRLQDAAPARCGVIVTAENNPHGRSLRDRFLTLELQQRSTSNLPELLAEGARGTYARAMAGAIQWIAGRRAELLEQAAAWRAEGVELYRAYGDRTAKMLADARAGVILAGRFGVACGAWEQAAADEFIAWATTVLGRVGAAQGAHKEEEDPARRFGQLLGDALGGLHAHVQLCDGGSSAPPSPSTWGWTPLGVVCESVPTGRGDREEIRRDGWKPSGTCVGYFDPKRPDVVFVNPANALGVVRAHAARLGHPFPLSSPRDLLRRLHDGGHLAETDLKGQRQTYTKRKRVGGSVKELLWLKASSLGLDLSAPDTEEGADAPSE